MSLTGKTVFVTGAAGILGMAFVETLAGRGARVVGLDLASALEKIEGRFKDNGNIEWQAIDLADPDDIAAVSDQLLKTYGAPDGLVNNAASKGADFGEFVKDALSLSAKTWREVTAVNLDGTFLLTQALGRGMVEKKSGSVVFIGSIYGEMGPDPRIYEGSQYMGSRIDTPPVYSATKAALSGLTRYLAAYWGQHNIRVNCLCPGGISSGQNETFETLYSARVPLQRMGKPQDIADPLAFLVSDRSNYITGQVLMVDGGLSAW